MIRCNRTQCKSNNSGICKMPNPDISLKGNCNDYLPDECVFDVANKGKCCAKTAYNTAFCFEHMTQTCIICGKQAVKQCLWPVDDEDGVCGANLCGERECFKRHRRQEHEEKPIEAPEIK